jgi:putative ABC transport system permease protein
MLRHKVQMVVLGMVLLVSTASATLGLALLAASSGPFQHAFNAQDGAHLIVTVNPARAGAAQLAATRSLRGVSAMAGPFGEATVQTQWSGQPFGQLTLVGRSSPGGPVDDVVLNAGHWATGPGQIVLAGFSGGGGPVAGSTVSVTGLAHPVTLTVVGFASSITNTADGWVAPAEVASLEAPGAPSSAQLLYRFTSAGTQAQVRADLAEVTGALPPGAVTGAGSWLAAESQSTGNGAIMEPFVVAFALIGLAMAVLIVANVVSGAVAAGYYRIGVLKSIGLTPAQVVVAYLSRVGVPALAGCVLGVVAGNLLAVPVLHQSADAYGVGSQTVPWWASVLAPAGMLVLTALAAFGPALRAGRLSATQAIAAGRAPSSGRGYMAYRLAERLRLPRPVGMGLAAPFARPARTLVSLAAIAFGATAVIFAFGLSASLGRAAGIQTLSATVPVQIQQQGPGGGPNQFPTATQDAAVTVALRAQPGTAHQTEVYQNQVKVPGVAGGVNAWAFSDDASWIGYGVITGHWYDAPGQVDVNTAFLNASGLAVGDTATVDTGTAQVAVHIVGEVFHPSSQPAMYGSTGTLPGLAGAVNVAEWDVGLRPGVNAAGYVQAVNGVLGSGSPWAATTHPQGGTC